MRRFLVVGVAALLVAGACGSSSSGPDGRTTRTVLVDFSSDEFGSFYLFNFPKTVAVRQGDTVAFKQTWTGEPHTVTGGTLVAEPLQAGTDWIDFFEAFDGMRAKGAKFPNPEAPGDARFTDFTSALAETSGMDALRVKLRTSWNKLRAAGAALPDLDHPADQSFADVVQVVQSESDKAFSGLPSAFADDDTIAQFVGQPCFLREGAPKDDEKIPCDKAKQRQPAFDGRFSFYNSGIIPYQGPRGNTFTMKVADDTPPGTYAFFCTVHGPLQRSDIEVRPKGASIPSQADVSRSARKEIDAKTIDLRKQFADAKDDGRITIAGPAGDMEVQGPFAGLAGGTHTAINAFLPGRIKVKAGAPITWKMMGADHTITFNVPKYFPIIQYASSGTVQLNPKLLSAGGGAVPLPATQDGGGGGGGGGASGPVRHDGGTFDGTGFWSSGLIGAEPYLEYTMRITKPGTYNYACLLHPPMVGKIEVT